MKIIPLALMCAWLCCGCMAPQYTLVPAGKVRIGASHLQVTPGIPWNRVPPAGDQRRWQTVWTQYGPLLDTVSLVGGLPDGEAIIIGHEGDPVPVPEFDAAMSSQDLVSMMQTMYRARGIETFESEPATATAFLGGDGVRFEFHYSSTDSPTRRGVCVMRIVDRKLYALALDAESTHYFGALSPEFEKLVATARLR